MKGFLVLWLTVLSGLQFCNYPDPNDGGKEVAPASGTWSDMKAAFTTAYSPDWSYFIPKSYLLLDIPQIGVSVQAEVILIDPLTYIWLEHHLSLILFHDTPPLFLVYFL